MKRTNGALLLLKNGCCFLLTALLVSFLMWIWGITVAVVSSVVSAYAGLVRRTPHLSVRFYTFCEINWALFNVLMLVYNFHLLWQLVLVPPECSTAPCWIASYISPVCSAAALGIVLWQSFIFRRRDKLQKRAEFPSRFPSYMSSAEAEARASLSNIFRQVLIKSYFFDPDE